MTKLTEECVKSIVCDAVEIERKFVCDALPCALVWMTRELMSQYIESVMDRLLGALGYGKGKTNFFEKRVGDYQKASVALYVGGLYICGKTMMVWLWGVNLWVFSRTGVDYAAIFYLGPDHHSHKEIWKVLQFLSYLPSLSNDFLKPIIL
ncbi:unnamed protein product [Brassica rapa subsp. trilocularis]